MTRGMIVKGRLWIAGALLMVMASGALGQWDTYVQLTDDDHTHYYAQVLVDSLYHVHLFDCRTLNPGPWENGPSSLFYQQFTNWGEPLTEAIDIIPGEGDGRYVSQPGLFLDSHGSIHVACSVPGPPGPDFYYLRLNLNGEVVTPPYPVAPDHPFWFDMYANINMCETSDGHVWIACDQYYFVVDQDGQMVVSRQPVVIPFNLAMNAHFQSTTDDQVWAAIRYFGHPSYPQIAAVLRIDIPDQVPEVVSAPDSGELMQMGPGDFFIDSSDVFHYWLGREDVGVFYQRDPRDSSGIDTVVIEPEPYGSLNTRFTLVGGDTLTYLWDRALPEPTVLRIGIHLSGDRAYGALPVPESSIGITDGQQIQWRGGGYWIAGIAPGDQEFIWQAAMIHVPGEDEPPNALSPYAPTISRSARITIFPNPFVQSASILIPEVNLPTITGEIYNVIGQRVQSIALSRTTPGNYLFQLDSQFSSGRYFLNLRHYGKPMVIPFHYLR